MGDLLTKRQQEVLLLLSQGLGPAAIAERLELTLPTVRNHISAVRRRLGCHSQLEAVAVARRLELV